MIEPLAALAARAAAALMERQQTIAVADGATGGLMSAGLLTVPGATAFYLGGGVIYSLYTTRNEPDVGAEVAPQTGQLEP